MQLEHNVHCCLFVYTEMVNRDLLKTDPSIKSFILLSETSQTIYMHVYYKDSAMYVTVMYYTEL